MGRVARILRCTATGSSASTRSKSAADGGHIVALGLPQTPFPLGGEVGDVIEDVRRLGGMSIAAHPDSTRAELRLADWDAPFDGIEWLNGDSQWRDEEWNALGRSLLTYPFRRAATLATLLDRPEDLVSRWDRLLRRRPVVAVAAADAHARVGPGGDPYGRSLSLHVPSYEQMFRTLSISLPRVQLRRRRARGRPRRARGHSPGTRLFVNRCAGEPRNFHLRGDERVATRRDGRAPHARGPGHCCASRANAPEGSNIKLLSDGGTVASGAPPALEYQAPPVAGVYRVEIDVPTSAGNPASPVARVEPDLRWHGFQLGYVSGAGSSVGNGCVVHQRSR